MLQINFGSINIKVYESRFLPNGVYLIEDKIHSTPLNKVYYTSDIYKVIFSMLRNDFDKAVEACIAYAKNKIDNFTPTLSMDIKYSTTKN